MSIVATRTSFYEIHLQRARIYMEIECTYRWSSHLRSNAIPPDTV